ncbi:COG complex component [Phanerochaete sordida]|uniref:Conserved oligomeric Golgi complex subunit 2 n=1 Tax=Phanerochaete sordida TaxID=48140 RepID=A0A9P3GD63_9APHY|nr:COG complex component [Phanerochaete sordida]
MSMLSPTATSRDPMELDRLAEELVTRESGRSRASLGDGEHDLPAYVPLTHDNPYLSVEAFNVEDFLLSRAYTSLPDLRSELRDYLATLKEELVKLINDDYEAFISLSTDLRGEGARLERLKWPLGDLRGQVLESRAELQSIQDAIQHKLQKRTELREEKTFLHLLLKISESVTRLESLLLISAPSDEDQGQTEIHGMALNRTEEERAEERTRANRAKHLSRVAAEYTQLLYHVSKAQTERCAFVDECQWRIDRIKSTLSSDLDHLFSSTVLSLTQGRDIARSADTTELDKAKVLNDVADCLRTYDMLGLWQDAEEVLRTDVVRSFVKKTIYPGCLAAPQSPVLPHTPFPPARTSSTTGGAPPRTPYTPFTAFASKQNPFEASFDTQPHILDDTDDPLAALYNTILRFVDRDMKRIMELADKVGVRSSSRVNMGKVALLGPSAAVLKDAPGGFEIMANVVWSEIGKAIMDELGSTVFAVGKPDEFRKHYETTQAFIRSLEYLAPSVEAVSIMRSHPVYIAFERRWQLPVYFQMRWKETVTKLEDSLIVTKLERSSNKVYAPFVTSQAAAVWAAISSIWSAQVFVPELSHRFWRLTLQLISRYRSWLDSSMPALEPVSRMPPSSSMTSSTGSPSLNRAATPTNQQVEAASPESVAADDALLVQLATVLTDIKAMESQVWKLWREELSAMLPDLSEANSATDASVSLEDTLRHSLSSLISLIPPISGQIIAILSRRGYDTLLPMRSIPSQFRAMTASRRLPTEPSHFVSLIFRALKVFFGIGAADAPGANLKDEFLHSYAEEVFENVAQRYIYFLTAMKKTEESLRRLKKGKRSAFSLFGSSSTNADDGRADEEKIRTQMILDVNAFGKDAESLGVAVDENSTYRALKELANAPLTED